MYAKTYTSCPSHSLLPVKLIKMSHREKTRRDTGDKKNHEFPKSTAQPTCTLKPIPPALLIHSSL
jgi:hypothetical protein